MTIEEFNKKGNILFMIYYRHNGYHIIKFDCTQKITESDINNEDLIENKTFYGGLPDNEFNILLKGKKREEAILELTISSLNNLKFFSEKINENNFINIDRIYLDKALLK